jgi:hypothetical protein
VRVSAKKFIAENNIPEAKAKTLAPKPSQARTSLLDQDPPHTDETLIRLHAHPGLLSMPNARRNADDFYFLVIDCTHNVSVFVSLGLTPQTNPSRC